MSGLPQLILMALMPEAAASQPLLLPKANSTASQALILPEANGVASHVQLARTSYNTSAT